MPVNNLITVRKGTSSQWNSANPVLASGELGYDLTNNIFKIGDGSTAWNSLTNHKHSSSNITDFNSSVSGLLPSISGSEYVNLSFDNNSYTISVSGLQPSGNYAPLFDQSLNTYDSPIFNELTCSGIMKAQAGFIITDINNLAAAAIDPQDLYLFADNFKIDFAGSNGSIKFSDGTIQNTAYSGIDIIGGTGIFVQNTSGIYTINSTGSGVLSDQSKSLVTTVFNKTGSPIPKMSVVYINGGQGDQPTIQLAVATGDSTSAGTFAVTYEAIPNMSSGKVIVFGALTGLNTDQFNPTAPTGDVNGTVLYLSPTVPGALTTIKPHAPYHMVVIGTIVRTHQNEGVIEVRIQNGYELEELHNVSINEVNNGELLRYNSNTQLWISSSGLTFDGNVLMAPSGNLTNLTIEKIYPINDNIQITKSNTKTIDYYINQNTTNNTPTTQLFTISNNRIWQYHLKLNCLNTTTNETCYFTIKGCIKNINNIINTVGSQISETWRDNNMDNVSCLLVNNNGLELQITGLTSNNLSWNGVLTVVELVLP